MTKITLFIGSFLLLTNIYGQDVTKKYGLKAGLNYSKYTPNIEINGMEFLNYERRIGFYIGGYLNFEFSNVLKLQPELLFALQGSNSSSDIELRNSPNDVPEIKELKASIKEATISIPLMLQLYPTKNFYFELGPQIGIILAKKQKITKDPFPDSDSQFSTRRNCSSCDKLDFGGALGLGYKLSQQTSVNFRYFTGFLKRDNAIKSSVFNLGIEYQI